MANQFTNMLNQVPGNTQQKLAGVNQASVLQAQKSAGGTALGQPTPQGIPQQTQVASGVAQNAANAGLKVNEETRQDTNQLAGQAIQSQGLADAQSVAKRKLDLQRKEREAQSTLSNLNSSLKNKLFDENMQFGKDELGRTLFNDRQLLDFKVATAKSDIELKKFEQDMRQASARKIQILAAAQQKLKQALEQSFSQGEQNLDQDSRMKIAQAKIAAEAKMKKEANKQKNRAAIISAAGTIAGGVVGFVATGGNPMGAMAGASMGGGLASSAAGATA